MIQSQSTSSERESSRQVLQDYLEGQIREYSEMCDTLRAYYTQNTEKIETCKTDIRIMKSREDSGFAMLSPISIESSFQVEIAQALEKQELLEKQNEKYLRDIHFYEGKIREMEEQLEKAEEQEAAEKETAAAAAVLTEPSSDEGPADDVYRQETTDNGNVFPGSTKEDSYRGDFRQDLQALAQTVAAASRFSRVDPHRTSMELGKAEEMIRKMIEKVAPTAAEAEFRTSVSAEDGLSHSPAVPDPSDTVLDSEENLPRDQAAGIKNESEPSMHLPHSSYLRYDSRPEVYHPETSDDLPERDGESKQEELICVQASDISDVFEEYVNSYASISSKRTDYYYEDELEMDVPKDTANRFVILCQKFYRYLLNYANCAYIQFHLQSHHNVLAAVFEWTSEDTNKDMEETVEWYNLRKEALKNGLDVNRNCFDNDVIRITVACNVNE